ncbi:MAG TPA: SDR family oxidoreductase [Streptosporangiaceae bacterium]|nr:SDR family oxidoreductase [Streptosporangiaceae bacterium]
MKIGVIGATGGTGGLIVNQLIGAGHDVRAIVRRGADEDRLRATGAEVSTLDLTQAGAADAEASLSGLDVVINAAAARGTGGGQARAVDQDGVKAAIDAAKNAGVRRWIQISMWGSDDPGRLPAMLRETGEAKRAADDHLAASGMTWTVIRPPWLTDSPPDDRIIVGDQVEEGSIPRADVAAVAIACLDTDATHDRLFEVTGGGDRSVRQALAGLG